MNEWLKCMIGYYLLVSITMHILPGKKYEQYVRLFMGFLLILFLIRPILSISFIGNDLEENFMELVEMQEKLEMEFVVESEELFNKEEIQAETDPVEVVTIPKVEVKVGD